jgi:predicted nicotinamide N-methyase
MPAHCRNATDKTEARERLFLSSNYTEAFGLKILKNAHPDMRKIRREYGTPNIHGNKFWKSTFLLMDYLKEYPIKKRAKVLEVGCGYGIGGLFCAKHFSASLTSLDADPAVFPFLEHHAQLNQVKVTTWRSRYEKVRVADLEQFDLVIGADICFWDAMSEALYNLSRRATRTGKTRVVLTDPGRPPFRWMAEKAVEKLGAEYLDWHVAHPHNASGLVLDIDPRSRRKR